MLHEAEASGVVVEPRVRAALLSGAAVVALESTIISHGAPLCHLLLPAYTCVQTPS